MKYSRNNPSPRYLALLEEYKIMHRDGDPHQEIPSEVMYAGYALSRHIYSIKKIIIKHRAQSIMDYGSGKGVLYEETQDKSSVKDYWGVEICCYDPAYPPFSTLPHGKFDGVICIDVLEHIPEEDIDWVLHEMVQFATKFIYINLATYPAEKCLPSGKNPHCTVKPIKWWKEKLEEFVTAYPHVTFYLKVGQSSV